MQVKDCVSEQVQQLVPNLVTGGIANHVPSMIDEVGPGSSTWHRPWLMPLHVRCTADPTATRLAFMHLAVPRAVIKVM
jgi:hypothetical protein